MYRIGSSLRSAVSPSMIVALIALFVAVGGNAYATQRQRTVLGADIVTRVTASPSVAPGALGMAVSMCPSGYRAIGGGTQHLHDFSRSDDWWDTLEAGPVITGTRQQPYPWWQPSEAPSLPEQQLSFPLLTFAKGWGAWLRNVGSAPEKFTVAVVCAPVVVDPR